MREFPQTKLWGNPHQELAAWERAWALTSLWVTGCPFPAVPPPGYERLGTSHLHPPQLVPSGVFFSVIEEKAKAPGLTGTQTMLVGPGSPVLLNPVQLCATVSQRERDLLAPRGKSCQALRMHLFPSKDRKGSQNTVPVLMLCDVISCPNSPLESAAPSEVVKSDLAGWPADLTRSIGAVLCWL